MTADSLRSPSSTVRGSVEPLSEFGGSHGGPRGRSSDSTAYGFSGTQPLRKTSNDPLTWQPSERGAVGRKVLLGPGTDVPGPAARPAVENSRAWRAIVKRCRRGDLNPRPQDLSRGAGVRPAMSPVLYRAEPLRQEPNAPGQVPETYAAEPSPAAVTVAASAGDGPSARATGSGDGTSSDIVPNTSERRISIFFRGYRVLSP